MNVCLKKRKATLFSVFTIHSLSFVTFIYSTKWRRQYLIKVRVFSISSRSGDGGSALQGLLGNWVTPGPPYCIFPWGLVTASISALPRHLLGFFTASSTFLATVRRCSETPFTTQVGGKSANEPCSLHHFVAPWCRDTNHSASWHPQGPWDAQHRSPLLFDSKAIYFCQVLLYPLGSSGPPGEDRRGSRKQVFLRNICCSFSYSIIFPFSQSYLSWGHTCLLVWLK